MSVSDAYNVMMFKLEGPAAATQSALFFNACAWHIDQQAEMALCISLSVILMLMKRNQPGVLHLTTALSIIVAIDY